MAQEPHSLERTDLLSDGNVFHYTCNPPRKEILDRHGIRQIGAELGCADSREVLLIPSSAYKRYGLPVRESSLQATSEILLRKMDYK